MAGDEENLTISMVLSWDLVQPIKVAELVGRAAKKLKQELTDADDQVQKAEPWFGEQAGASARTLSKGYRTDGEATAGVYVAMAKAIQDGCGTIGKKIDMVRDLVSDVQNSDYDLFYEDDGSVKSRVSNWETAAPPWGIVSLYLKQSEINNLDFKLRNALWAVAQEDERVAERVSQCIEKLADSVKTEMAGVYTDKDLLDILKKYQTPDSTKDGVMWPNATQLQYIRDNVDPTFQPKFVTAEEAAVLNELSLGEQVKFLKIQMAAGDFGKHNKYTEVYSQAEQDGKGDAARHIYWNARMTQEFGTDWTERYTTAHEKTGGNVAAREAMDLYNNSIGRDIGQDKNADDSTIRARVQDAIDNGKAVVIVGTGSEGKTPQLAWSRDTPTDQTIVGPGVGIPLPGTK
ncbi:DUF6973 domain-containing protein [Nocardia sp. NPDC059764]|uniref:DUF6973 domain-containing protein n=1 Tax=Nocardia sp. NPDC059764 TaxID=3346939 RepID=UPI00364D0D0A